MQNEANGTFVVQLKPLKPYAQGEAGNNLGRMSIDKTFSGDLEAVSKGEMLSARTVQPSSAGYVAIEQVKGSLNGRQGSFVLQHFGTMSEGNQRLILEVVPNSGTGGLAGIQGEMEITIENGTHYYCFQYTHK